MRFTTAAFITLTIATGAVTSVALRAQQPATTTWDGVYTAEQAKRGETAYGTACASCHGGDLAGDGFAPALSGSEFANTWNGTPVSDLYERIRSSMPPSGPDEVPAAEKVDIVAYLLKANKFPEGTTELPSQAEAMKTITFKANKP